MSYTNLLYETERPYVAKVTINRPGVLNAIDYATAVELKRVFSDIAANRDIRAVLITGAGEKSFVVGADRQETKLHAKDEERARAFEEAGRDVCNLIDALSIPSIAAINGHALGMGLQLALACTFRIASSNARFALPEINIGFFPSMGATQRLTRLVGAAKATEMILTGETIDAAEALRAGLVHRVIPQAEFSGVVEQFAGSIAEKNPVAVRLAMEAIQRGKEMPLVEGLRYEAKLSEECLKK